MCVPESTTIERMQRLLQQWNQQNDRRAIFLGCYHLMTLNMFKAIRLQEFLDPAWVEHLLNHFASYYFLALDAYENNSTNIPAVWNQTFQVARQPDTSVLKNLLLGVNAHINYDLIFTLVDVLEPEWRFLSYAHRQKRYADHSYVNNVISRTIDAVQDTIIETRQPLLNLADELLGPVDELAVSSLIHHWRNRVWQNAVNLLETQDPNERQQLSRQIELSVLHSGELISRVL